MAGVVIDPEFLAQYGIALGPILVPSLLIRPRSLRDLPAWAAEWYLNNEFLRIDTGKHLRLRVVDVTISPRHHLVRFS